MSDQRNSRENLMRLLPMLGALGDTIRQCGPQWQVEDGRLVSSSLDPQTGIRTRTLMIRIQEAP